MTMTRAERDELAFLSRAWWLPVVIGVLLVLYSFAVFSFTITTVKAIAWGLGVGLLVAGLAQLMLWKQVQSWRWLVLLAGILNLVLAAMAFAWPEATFLVMARLVGWVLLLSGIIDVVRSFEERRLGADGWWASLVIGLVSIVVAVWATRYPGREIALLVLWVGIAVMMRGAMLIVVGFTLRKMRPGGAVAVA